MMKGKLFCAAVALIVSIGLSFAARSHDFVDYTETFVPAIKALGEGEECFTTEQTGVVIKVIDVPCPSDQLEVEREILNLTKRIGAKKNLFEGTVVTLTPHWIIVPRRVPGGVIWILAYGVTWQSQSVVMYQNDKAPDWRDVLVHELAHVAWNRVGLDSSFIDGGDSPEKRAVMDRTKKTRQLPADHPAVKKFKQRK